MRSQDVTPATGRNSGSAAAVTENLTPAPASAPPTDRAELPALLRPPHGVPRPIHFLLWTPGASEVFLIVEAARNVLGLGWQSWGKIEKYTHTVTPGHGTRGQHRTF